MARLANSKRLVAVDKRNIVSLPDPAMTGYAVLIENRPDVPAEIHAVTAGSACLAQSGVMPCLYAAPDHHRRESYDSSTPYYDRVVT